MYENTVYMYRVGRKHFPRARIICGETAVFVLSALPVALASAGTQA